MNRPVLDPDQIGQRLEDERDSLLTVDGAAAGERRPVELDQTRVGRLSRMDALQVQAMAKAVGVRRQGRLRRIDAALARLAAGDFGFCVDCGKKIPIARLEIDPVVERCVTCAEAG